MKTDNKKKIFIRCSTALLMFCCIMWGYWWMTWCLAIGLLFYFPAYYEIIVWGIIYDALYAAALPEFWTIRYIFSVSSIVLFLIAYFLRKKLLVYDDA